jgi:gas vesicle protein
MGQTPDELKRQVERTRADLSSNVDTLADRVNPAQVARRRTQAMRASAVSLKERVMGSASDTLQSVRESASDATTSLGGAAQRAPGEIRANTRGNPLAAGLIAFGTGMVAAALMPASQAETRAVTTLRENTDKLEPAKQALSESAQHMKENLAPAAQDAVQHVKDMAADAARTTSEQAKESGSGVADQAKSATADLRDHATQSASEVREQTRQ